MMGPNRVYNTPTFAVPATGAANIGPTGIWTVMATAKIGTRELSAIAMTFVKVRILLFWCPGSGDPSTCAH